MPKAHHLTPGRIAVMVTVLAVLTGIALTGGGMFSPGKLNAQQKGSVQLGGVYSHAELGGKCSACHAPPWSGQTMADRCVTCHTDVRGQIDGHQPLHGRLDNGTACSNCHTEHKGASAPITNLSTFDHNCAAFALTGKHASVDCKQCHKSDTFKGTPATCVGCHAEPKMHAGQFGTDCKKCHATDTWHVASFPVNAGVSGGGSAFDHSKTAFPLTGHHSSVDCKQCHVNNKFKGTPTSCISCHMEPKVHLGKFGTDCKKCHATETWKLASIPTGGPDAVFDHSLTGFPLTGHHVSVDCKKCHVNDKFKGTPTSCVSCHAEPKIAAHTFGTDCMKCHTTATWKLAAIPAGGPGAGFDHNLTAFKLTGKHTAVACAQCHKDGKFKGTSMTCVSCHEEPKVHKGSKLGTDCAKCHTTATWSGGTLGDFKHVFPVAHGRKNRGASACKVCHEKPDAYATYTCYGCHEHNPAKIAQKHKKVANLDACVKCHKGGRGRDRAALDLPGDEFLASCPADECSFAGAAPQSGCPYDADVVPTLRLRVRSGDQFDELLASMKPTNRAVSPHQWDQTQKGAVSVPASRLLFQSNFGLRAWRDELGFPRPSVLFTRAAIGPREWEMARLD